jgi:hypothetical protein
MQQSAQTTSGTTAPSTLYDDLKLPIVRVNAIPSSDGPIENAQHLTQSESSNGSAGQTPQKVAPGNQIVFPDFSP